MRQALVACACFCVPVVAPEELIAEDGGGAGIAPRMAIRSVTPSGAGPGDIVTITGVGFGDDPLALSVIAATQAFDPSQDPPPQPWIPLGVLSASDSEIRAVVGPVPPRPDPDPFKPGPILVGRGTGARGTCQPSLSRRRPRRSDLGVDSKRRDSVRRRARPVSLGVATSAGGIALALQ